MSKTVTVTPDFDALIKRLLDALQDEGTRRRILNRASLEVKDRASAYPPEGPWNKYPGTKGRWYQRQFGPRWQRKDGSTGGKNTSQKLQKSWRIEAVNSTVTSVYTEVTYAPYLLDKQQRASWAAKHGWQTTDEIAQEYQPRFVALALEEIDKAVDDTLKGA